MTLSVFEIATTIQEQFRQRFSEYQLTNLEIDGNADEPTIKLELRHKLTKNSQHLLLITEQQADRPQNIHFTLLDNNSELIQAYQKQRGAYVNANHQTAEDLKNKRLIPENIYLIRDAAGRPGMDFLNLNEFMDALNTLMLITKIFQKKLQ